MMTALTVCGSLRTTMVVVLLFTALGVSPVTHAQVTTNITSSGLGTAINGSTITPCVGGTCTITGGTRQGQNLFHGFGRFDIGASNTALFSNDTGQATSNIVGRVTGGQTSNIFGTIQTATNFGAANLFLMNPAGWLFGRTAQLNVGGSFHATTADYVKLGTDGVFFADATKASALTSAPPSAFGFLTSNPAAIDVQTGNGSFGATRLQVPVNKTLSLVGGTVTVGVPSGPFGGFIYAPGNATGGGIVNIASVASPGEATISASTINVDSFTTLGDIRLKGGALIDGREINIRGGRLEIRNATLFPGAAFNGRLAGSLPPNGGQVNIKVTGAVTITGAETASSPALPGITTFNGSTSAVVAGNAPGINIDAGAFSITGRAGIVANRLGPGNGSSVVIKADTIEVRNGSSIALSNFFGGGTFPTGGGSLTISGNNLTLSSDGSSRTTGIGTTGNFYPAYGGQGVPFSPFFQFADSAPVTMNLTGNLTVLDNARITTDSFAFGRSGPINISAANMLLVGSGAETGRIAAQSGFNGESGNVSLTATGKIDLQNGFLVSANTFGSGNGGVVDVTAGQSITLTGTNSRILSGTLQVPDQELNINSFAQKFNAFFTAFFKTPIPNYAALRTALGVAPATGDLMQVLAKLNAIKDPAGNRLVAVTDFTPGDAGTISFRTPLMMLNADTRVETSTGWNGNAGAVLGNVGSIFVADGAAIRSTSGIVRLTGETSVGAGNAGSVTLTASDANTISITGRSPTTGAGSSISTTTLGAGKGGDVILNSAGKILISNGGEVTSSTTGAGAGGTVGVTASDLVSLSGSGTGLFSTASNTGAGGDINVQAPQVQIFDGATMSADSTGTATATAGNVNIVTSELNMQNSSITTGATLADGGNISITTTGSIVQLNNSQITTSVQSGVGGGGNITIDSDLVVLNDSQILANAFGGPGGNINITADVFLVNSGGTLPTSLAGIVDASSALSTPGTINIEAAFTDVAGEVAQLPEAPLQATELLRASCAARFAGGKASSLVLGGRDGVPIQPGGLLPSPINLATDSGNPATGMKTSANDLHARFTLLGSVDSKNRLLTRYSLLPNAKCAF